MFGPRAPAQDRFVPDGRQAIDFQMWIAGQQGPARGAALGPQRPGIAAGQPGQIAEQFQGFVGELAADV